MIDFSSQVNELLTAHVQKVFDGLAQGFAQAASDIAGENLDVLLEVANGIKDNSEWGGVQGQLERAMSRVELELSNAASKGSEYDEGLKRKAHPLYVKGGFDSFVTQDGPASFTVVVRVRNRHAARLSEEFIPPWDMKPGILAGKNRKMTTGKDPRPYNTIRIRHQTPGTAGRAGAAMPTDVYAQALEMTPWEYESSSSETFGEGYDAFAGHRLLRNDEKTRKVSLRQRGDVLQWGGEGKKKSFFTHSNAPGERLSLTRRNYQHSASIYQGMVRVTLMYESKKQQHYMTFRRVSENSAENSWWHPGFKLNPISEIVQEKTKPLVQTFLENGVGQDIFSLMGAIQAGGQG